MKQNRAWFAKGCAVFGSRPKAARSADRVGKRSALGGFCARIVWKALNFLGFQ